MKIVLDLPDSCKPGLGDALRGLAEVVSALERKRGRHGDFTGVEMKVAEATARVEAESVGVILRSLDEDAPMIRVDGRSYRRLPPEPKTYRTLAGEVTVDRHLYRAADVRNGPTLDPIAIRVGMVGDGWLPGAAKAMAHGLAMATSREAASHAKQVGRLPYSRSSFERVGHLVGAAYCERNLEIEDVLATQFEVPNAAQSVSVSIDRAAVPMEEIATDGENVVRKFRMAHCATLTFHNHEAEALHVTRYGRMAGGDTDALDETLYYDLASALEQRPGLKVVLLADGAEEMWNRLEVIADGIADDALRLVDFWHVCEYLGAASAAMGSDTVAAGTTLDRWKSLLLSNTAGWAHIVDELRTSETLEARTAVRYLENHSEMLDYATAWATGLPIGSGNVEATCKSLLGQRFKRCGARWKTETGEQVVQLRALELSDRWDDAIKETLRPLRRIVRRVAA